MTETVDIKERSKFILMDKIQPPIKQNYIVRAELLKPVLADVLSEIGCFGILIRLVRPRLLQPTMPLVWKGRVGRNKYLLHEIVSD